MVRSATQSVWYSSRGTGLTLSWQAPVSPPPAPFIPVAVNSG